MLGININLGNTNKIDNGCHTLSGNIKVYIKDGLKHRLNGPAEIHLNSGKKIWFKMGKKHRIGGPAVEYPDKPESNEYWVDGIRSNR